MSKGYLFEKEILVSGCLEHSLESLYVTLSEKESRNLSNVFLSLRLMLYDVRSLLVAC